ncbi:MAG: alkaline phosphatase family protein, partial [Prevotella sp.]
MKSVLILLFVSISVFSEAQIQRPKLVVGLMVDQMRWDYLYYYYNDFGEGGLRRLVDEGYSYENTMINYVPAVTAIGHSSVWSGSIPALTGIAANTWFEDGAGVYCCQDSAVKSVGSDSKEGQMSPHRFQASTIG